MKVALVHDWLVTNGGAERVLAQMLACYPQADVFTLVDFLSEADRGFLKQKKPITSFLQRMPGARRSYRNYLPLMPLAIEQFDLSAYDLVISSSHAVAKGVIVGPDQLHVCLCYSPIRYAWDMQHQYMQEVGLRRGFKSWIVKWILHKLRVWDVRTSQGVDQFIAVSHYIARRIQKTYRRDSVVIYPPVDLSTFGLHTVKADYYFTASRHVPYKKIPLIIEAFNSMPDKRLVVMGDGPEFEKCKKLAGPNVQMLGHQPLAVLREYLQSAKAFIFAAEEDFGIAPLEAQACGTPVIAFKKGGARETIRGLSHASPTGVFFESQTPQAIVDGVHEFELNQLRIDPKNCRANAERFSQEEFRHAFTDLVNRKYLKFQELKKNDEH